MSDKNLSTELAACLEWIEETGDSAEKAAARFPNHYRELINLLETVEQLDSAEQPSPSPEFQFAARTRLLNQINAKKSAVQAAGVTNAQAARHIWQSEKLRRENFSQHPPKRRFAMNWILIIGLLASVFAGGGGVAFASTDALPGDTLYPVKTMLQDMEMVFAGDEKDAELLMNQMFTNIEEMQQLATQERYGDMLIGLKEYQNNLEAMNQVRERINNEDAGTGDSLNTRLQEQLQTCTQLLEQLQTQLQTKLQTQLQTQDQLKIQDKIQEAIQETDTGNTYGPNEDSGQPEEPGDPNGVGPGETQGPGDQQPEDAGNPDTGCQGDDCGSGQQQPSGPNEDPGTGGGDAGQGGSKKP